MSLQGTVKFFSQKKGYGFINQPDGTEMFVHQKQVIGNPLQTNDQVTFDSGVDETTGRPAAIGVKGGTGTPYNPMMNKGGFNKGYNGGFQKGFGGGFGGGFQKGGFGGGKGFGGGFGGGFNKGGFQPGMGGGMKGGFQKGGFQQGPPMGQMGMGM